ncbi:MAG TPA: hypothetical protein VLW50_06595 [Streptosporangiaceae bacterium]|nr:hypothetical protein [Streptosporangiaceae bacterium]
MKIVIADMDGYLGLRLARHLAGHKRDVPGGDPLLRRFWAEDVAR